MILVLSDEVDQTTNDVIKWIKHFGFSFTKIIPTDHYIIESLKITNTVSEAIIRNYDNKSVIDLKDVRSVWFRRGRLNFMPNIDLESELEVPKGLESYLYHESHALFEYILSKLEVRTLGNYFNAIPNKLRMLEMARAVGLKIPDTIVSSLNPSLQGQLGDKGYITKAIQDMFHTINVEGHFISYTTKVQKNDFTGSSKVTYPSLIQEAIERLYEIRIFFFCDKIYSMAIISNDYEVDFRSSYETLRTIPYNLPTKIENKIRSFIEQTQFNTGSIDLIRSKDGEYYFLEINPLGQFGMVSWPCNYNLEYKIAKFLCYGF